MHRFVADFMCFSAPDPRALELRITETRVRLASAEQSGESLSVVDAAADLGSMLTTARMEVEAAQMLTRHVHHAQVSSRRALAELPVYRAAHECL